MHVLVAGPIAAGKTTYSLALASQLGATRLSVRQALLDALGAAELTRAELQRQGADLDQRTNGRWLLHLIHEQQDTAPNLVIDSLRTRRQTLPLLADLQSSVLIYLDAHDGTRRKRYEQAAFSDPVKATVTYTDAINHPTERQVTRLKPLAHLILETDDLTPAETVRETIRRLNLVRDL